MEEKHAEVDADVEVPSYFLCPISLDIMRDPVTLPTGITYDRDGIERWLLAGATSCPLTKQPVAPDCDPTPNHTLRRLIQSWCAHHLHGVVDDRVSSTPKQPLAADRARLAALVSKLADEIRIRSSSSSSPPREGERGELLAALRELKGVAVESERNRKLIVAIPGAVEALADVFVTSARASASSENSSTAGDEALDVISSLRLSEQCLMRVVQRNDNDGALLDALVSTLRRSNSASRTHAALLLEDVTAVMSPSRLVSLPEQVFGEVVQLLRDRSASSRPATKAALHVLVGATSWGRNRIKAVDAGAVPVLVDMLVEDAGERRTCELALGALDRLCGCAEGRAALVAHGSGVAVVGEKVLRVSAAASEKAVRVLRSVARHAATGAVVQEMAQTGVVRKLCLVVVAVAAARSSLSSSQYCSERTRERARETLRLHAGAWRSSPCLHPNLQALYPPPR